MNDNFISQSIATFFAVIMLFIIILVIKFFRVAFKSLLVKLNIIRKEDSRSYTEMIGYRIGKIIGKFSK
jgi:hypothetical protein